MGDTEAKIRTERYSQIRSRAPGPPVRVPRKGVGEQKQAIVATAACRGSSWGLPRVGSYGIIMDSARPRVLLAQIRGYRPPPLRAMPTVAEPRRLSGHS
jgi:hypothetical protein